MHECNQCDQRVINYSLFKVVDRCNETQLQVGENSNYLIYQNEGYATDAPQCHVNAASAGDLFD